MPEQPRRMAMRATSAQDSPRMAFHVSNRTKAHKSQSQRALLPPSVRGFDKQLDSDRLELLSTIVHL